MNKGFTLIELLAVMAVLAIISLIVIPVVLKTVTEVEENANLRSAEMYFSAVEQAVMEESMKTGEFFPAKLCIVIDGDLSCDNDAIKLKISITGTPPMDQSTITIDENVITEVNFVYEDQIIVLDENNMLKYLEE